jgi:hypothetical protein
MSIKTVIIRNIDPVNFTPLTPGKVLVFLSPSIFDEFICNPKAVSIFFFVISYYFRRGNGTNEIEEL